ncbi:hypothetical protein PS880_05621 [Pseudomonas fluorescens]|uniref:Uncharacterized protein n=1 Tax=Pseudomonas fluorescens TaxID=294 RepID=A0A5E7PYS6_PSEFL|nr:hypothetical protein PS880_05621 [Pseudomonas fluorescens]
MATTYRTSDGDLLDTLCQHYYGHLNGTVEAVLVSIRAWLTSRNLSGRVY